MLLRRVLFLCVAAASASAAATRPGSAQQGYAAGEGQAAPVVDLGYAKYQGTYNSTFNTNVYRGSVPLSSIVPF